MSEELRTYVARRVLLLVPTILGAVILVFIITQLFDPVERASLFVRSPQQLRDLPGIIEKYGLDKPFFIQFFSWLSQAAQGNLGWSFVANKPVIDVLVDAIPSYR